MRIEWAIACRFVEVHDGLATMVGAGIDRMTIPQVPADVGTWFAVRIAVAPGDEGDHQLGATILNGAMEPIAQPLAGMFHTEGPPHAQPGWEGHHTIPMIIGFPVTESGVYTVVFNVDDKTFDYPLVIDVANQG